MTAQIPVATKYNVGGILLDRPFKIRRLGHFGFNMTDLDAAHHFYADLLGFRVSDEFQRGGWFMRYGTDHHAFALFQKQPVDPAAAPGPTGPPTSTIRTVIPTSCTTASNRSVGMASPSRPSIDARCARRSACRSNRSS